MKKQLLIIFTLLITLTSCSEGLQDIKNNVTSSIDNTKDALSKSSKIIDKAEAGVKAVTETVTNGLEADKENIKISYDNAEGNTKNQSFTKAKKILERNIYNKTEYRKTFYCGCNYDEKKYTDKESCGFVTSGKQTKRSNRIEWEHVVPAEAFGNSFSEWRDGSIECITSKGTTFKGRQCARKANVDFRYMEADMYNLLPAIGEVNALRSNYSMAMIDGKGDYNFGKCSVKIKKGDKDKNQGGKIEVTDNIKGDVARIYMYMESAYPGHGIISNKNEKLFEAWSKMDPVSKEECDRYNRIKKEQGNENIILKQLCK